MRKPLAVTALGFALGAVFFPGAALAGTDVSPPTVRPGATVEIHTASAANVTCKASITGPGSFAVDVILKPASDGARGTVVAPGVVGVYRVSAVCDGVASGTTSFTVSPAGAPVTGDGGRSQNTGLFITGGAMVAFALGGMIVMRHRLVG